MNNRYNKGGIIVLLTAVLLTVADIAYSPCITRLDHLSMGIMWEDKPAIIDWHERIQATTGYEKGIRAFFVANVIENMTSKGNAAKQAVSELLGQAK